METTIENLLENLALYGGKIVSTASLDPFDIEQARASKRLYVNERGLGFAWEPNFVIPLTESQVIEFEKWYPLNVPITNTEEKWKKVMDAVNKRKNKKY